MLKAAARLALIAVALAGCGTACGAAGGSSGRAAGMCGLHTKF